MFANATGCALKATLRRVPAAISALLPMTQDLWRSEQRSCQSAAWPSCCSTSWYHGRPFLEEHTGLILFDFLVTLLALTFNSVDLVRCG